MSIQESINQMHKLVAEFADQTNAMSVEFAEDKKCAEWSIKYNIIKLEFVLTKKEKILCPIATLFCRVYLGKNETIYYHLPELMEHLEPENFQCYYFPYIESRERLEACFMVLQTFLRKHLSNINELAKSTELSEKIKADKIAEVRTLLEVKETEEEVLVYALGSFEAYALLPRYAADSAYREFVCGNYDKALKIYEQMQKKGTLTRYEKRLAEFIKGLEHEYVALPEACNSIRKVKEWNAPSKEGLSILLMAIICELVIGILFAGIIVVINEILSSGTVYYVGAEWYYAFLWAGLPGLFGGIAFRNGVRRFLQKDIYKEGREFEKLTNPKWLDPFANGVFALTFVGMLLMTVCTTCMSTRFYENYMVYNTGENFIPVDTTCDYDELTKVYYSEGLYNDYGDFIERASYLLEFSNGSVWDSDGFTSVEVVEEHILPLLEEYYEQVEYIKERNVFIRTN